MKPLMMGAAVALILGLAAVPAFAAQHMDNDFFSLSIGDESWSWDGDEAVMTWEGFERNVEQTATRASNALRRSAMEAEREFDEDLLDDDEDLSTLDDGEDRDLDDDRFVTQSNTRRTTTGNEFLRVRSQNRDLQGFDGVMILTGDQQPEQLAPIRVDLDAMDLRENEVYRFDTRLLLIDLTDRFRSQQRLQSVSRTTQNQSSASVPSTQTNTYEDDIVETSNRQTVQTAPNNQQNQPPVFTETANDGFNDPDLFGDPEDDGLY